MHLKKLQTNTIFPVLSVKSTDGKWYNFRKTGITEPLTEHLRNMPKVK
jgi:hypothetical protein